MMMKMISRYCFYAIPSSSSVSQSFYRRISTAAPLYAGKKWIDQRSRGPRGNSSGPLVDLPDWSYLDGRPAPMGNGQRLRKLHQMELGTQIVRQLKELELAKESREAAQRKIQNDRQEYIQSKLRPKGLKFVRKSDKQPLVTGIPESE